VGRVLAERWEVGDRIGMGGMASVHRGVDRRLGRAVAIKILHPHVAESPEARTRLAREARAIAQLKHENVIEVYDYSIDDPHCVWLVTELVEGSSLRGVVDRHPKLMPEVAALVVGEVVRALRAAHAVGVVHRDVKPDNVLVGREGRPKLSDFGIAQVIDEQRMTVTGNLVGSPTYMSPEQAEGRRTDHRTDLFSAGIMLYRMVTGVLPFQGQNAIETLRKVAAVVYRDPLEVDPSCPGSVAAVIRRALAPSIDDRYQSADEMAADLAAIAQDAGLGPAQEELQRFLGDPLGYEAQIAPVIARSLFGKGKLRLASGDEARALDDFTRARALGASDEQSLDLVQVLSVRREKSRGKRAGTIAAVAAAIGLALVVGVVLGRPGEGPEAAPAVTPPAVTPPASPAAQVVPTPRAEASPLASALPTPARPEVSPDTVPAPDRSPSPSRAATPGRSTAPRESRRPTPEPTPSASATPPPSLSPSPSPSTDALPDRGELQIGASRWADIYVNDVKLGRAPDQSRYRLPAGTHRLRAVNPHCPAVEQEITIRAGETTRVRLTIPCP
jgi:serine/threonine-protein kinase